MKRIVLLSFDYPPNNGGIARLCGGIINELKNRSIPYLVITNIRFDTEKDKNIIRVTGRRGIVELKIFKLLIKSTCSSDDIIICDTWHPAGFLSILSNRSTFILAHGAEFLSGIGFYRKFIKPYYRKWVLCHSNGIIANSHYTENLVNKIMRGLHVIALPLPIDTNRFKPTVKKNDSDTILRICSVSRLEQFKGHDFILLTVASLPEVYRKRLRLEIAGKGPFLESLIRLSHELKIDDIVTFCGFIAEADLCDFYSRNDIFILCTREDNKGHNVEGFGLVFTEAQACGTAVIGTKIGGIPDAVLDGQGGWLIDQDSKTELSNLLKKLIDNKLYTQNEGIIARKRVEKDYKWSDYLDKILEFVKYNC